jgi:hypothetical protein
MTTPVAAHCHQAKTVDPRRDEIEILDKAEQASLIQGSPKPLWVEARAQTIGFRHDDLVRTHWRKIGRSVHDD